MIRDDRTKEDKFEKQKQVFKEQAEKFLELKKGSIGLEEQNEAYRRRVGNMTNMVQNILVQLHKVKDEHLQMKKTMSKLEEENEYYKDRNGVDIGHMTPRPEWADLKDKYPFSVDLSNRKTVYKVLIL